MKSSLHPARRFLTRFSRPHIILPVSLLNSAAFTIVGLGFVFYLRDRFDATAGTIGFATGLFSALYFVGCFALRPLTSRILPRYSLILSAVTSMAMLALVVSAARLGPAVALYGVTGLALALFWPPIMGWLSAGVEGQALGREIARFNLAWSAGVVVGPLAAGFLTEVDVRLPIIVGIVMIAVVAAVIGLASAFVGTIRDDRYREPGRNQARTPDSSTPLRFPAWIGVTAAYTVLGTLLVVFPLQGRDHLGLGESVVGSVLLLRGLSATIAYMILGRSTGWHFRTAGMWIPLAVLAGATIVLSLLASVVVYALLVGLVGAAVAVSYTMSVFHGAVGSPDRTRRMAIHEALLTVGSVVGSSVGGQLFEHYGSAGAFGFCGIVIVGALGAQTVLIVRARRAAPSDGRPVAPRGRRMRRAA